MAAEQHETVGRTFKGWDGGTYHCIRWVRSAGFDMLCVETYEEHVQPCDCRVCEVRS